MSYEYKPSKAEQKAEALLREKGWSVSRPPCPDCHGMGYIFGSPTTSEVAGVYVSAVARICPRGCPYATAFYSNTISPGSRTVVAGDAK